MNTRRALVWGLAIGIAFVLSLNVVALTTERGEDRAAPSVTPTADETRTPPTSPSPVIQSPATVQSASPSPAFSPTPAISPATAPSPQPSAQATQAIAMTGPVVSLWWLGFIPLLGGLAIATVLRRA